MVTGHVILTWTMHAAQKEAKIASEVYVWGTVAGPASRERTRRWEKKEKEKRLLSDVVQTSSSLGDVLLQSVIFCFGGGKHI